MWQYPLVLVHLIITGLLSGGFQNDIRILFKKLEIKRDTCNLRKLIIKIANT